MKNTFRFSNRLFYSKVLISLILVITMVTSSLPIAYAEPITDSGKLVNANFENGDASWNKADGEITVKNGEGVNGTKALELTADSNAVYQTATRDGDKNYPKGTTFQWSLKYKSTASNDIGALVLGTNTPTATEGQNDQLRQMMTWLKNNRKIDTKIPPNGKHTVVVYSRPFDKNGAFTVDEKDTDNADFSLVPTIYCTEKFSVTLFRTTGTDWLKVDNSDNTKFTFNNNFESLCYSLISYSGNPLVDDVDLKIMYDDSVKEEHNNLRNGGFEDPTIESLGSTTFYAQPDHSKVPDWNTTAFGGKIELFKAEGNKNGHFMSNTNVEVFGKQAAELNADEPSTLYQYINTESGSKYKWQLSHRGRAGSDIMALVIGPKQYDKDGNVVNPAKTSKEGNDQFMEMIDWVQKNLKYYPEIASDITKFEEEKGKKDKYKCTPIKIKVYSRPFAVGGGFRDGLSTNFSSSESTVFTEKWDISLICTGYQEWGTYGANDSETYSEYDVPEGQKESIFAFTGYHGTGTNGQKNPTYGNLLDGIKFDLYYPARSISYTGGEADLTYVHKGEVQPTVKLKSGESVGSIMVDDNSTFTLEVKPKWSEIPVKDESGNVVYDENGNVKTTERLDAYGNKIQNAFLGAYITIGGEREYYPATAVDEDQAVYFSETVAEDGKITYSYGKSNVSGRIVVELIYGEVYTMTYNANGGAKYIVNSVEKNASYTGNMDWNGSNENVARFYEFATGTYTSYACDWWEKNDSVVFKGWQLVGGTIYKIESGDQRTQLTDTEAKDVLFKGTATVTYEAPEHVDGETEQEYWERARLQDFVISDGIYEGRVNAYTGGVLVANWEYKTRVVAQTEQLDGTFKDNKDIIAGGNIGGQVALKKCTMNITDDSGTIHTPPVDPENTDNIIGFTDEFTYTSSFNNVVTVSKQENSGYQFLGWYDESGIKLSSVTDHSYAVEPYYSDSDKTKETQTPSVIYARYGFSHKVKFHINDSATVSTVVNPDADLFRVYYPSTVTISSENNTVKNRTSMTYTIHNLDENNRISDFYDIPPSIVSKHGKIFMGWYLDKENNINTNPIKWNNNVYDKDTDIYAHWLDVGTMDKDAEDNKIIHQPPGNLNKLPGIDLLGVQIRYEDEDPNYPGGRGDGPGKSPHFDTDGLRFITCIKESILRDTSTLFKSRYTSSSGINYSKKDISYGYVIAKESTAKNKLGAKGTLEYNGTNVNGVNTSIDDKYNFAKNVDCTSSFKNYSTGIGVDFDHRNFENYRIYSMVITYKKDGKTDDQIASAKAENIIARPYLRYTDANGLYRTYYQDYKGTNVYGGCSTNYNAAKDFLSKNNYFPKPKN